MEERMGRREWKERMGRREWKRGWGGGDGGDDRWRGSAQAYLDAASLASFSSA